MLQNRPNPFDEATIISYYIRNASLYKAASVIIADMNGKIVWQEEVNPHEGINEVLYRHGYNMTGTFLYSLVLDGHVIETKKMVFAN